MMATPEGDIQATLMAHLATLVTVPDFPVYYREIPAPRPQTDYIEVDYLPNDNERVFLTGRLWRQGILQLTLCSALGQYEAVYRERAGQIAGHFARETVLDAGANDIEIVKVDIGRGVADGPHWRIPVSVYYRGFA